MTLDDLVNSIPVSEGNLRNELAHWVSEWKTKGDSLDRLSALIGKWHGNVWFKDANASNAFHRNWTQFKAKEIDCIDGMTMNERLFVFGLLDLWDNANEEGRKVLRAKVKANA
jgi:hypothetical protein